ncbi:molybdate ABC transporter permease subunit [Ilyobacter sp.]|jgi:molybdate transport system permease protein|uniref:molybdate ABC transporter permease subunit n=1 Tax=Ilyobacter sp. TaxID=3100343 RepID=UPI003565C9F3
MIVTPILISLKVAFVSTLFTMSIGVLLAWIFTKHPFKGKDFFEGLIILPMVLPPSVTGYALLMLFGKNGLLGELIYKIFGTSLIFTWKAACVASFVVSLPLMYQSCKAAFINIDSNLEKAARTLGADEKRIFWKIGIPMAAPGIISGTILSFTRALGEFGATLMVAGNIPGKTQTIPIAIYFAVDSGDRRTANILVGIVVIFSFLVIYGLNIWNRKKNRY